MTVLSSKDSIKGYTLFAIAFACSLFIPSLIYSLRRDPIFADAIHKPYSYPPMVKYSYKWPDISSFTHGVPAIANATEENDIYKEIDQRYCGQDRCRFLLPIAITEQESKAQLHFRQLAFLAGKIDRTIVLPNVYSSHMGSCLPHPFSFYYDLKWLNDNTKHFNYITMEDFKAWLLERHYAGVIPSGQEIYMQGSRKSRLLKNIKNCFSDSFDFSGRPTVSYQLQDHQNQRHINITDIMVDLFSDKARQHEYLDGMIQSPFPGAAKKFKVHTDASSPPVDVINLFYDRRYKFINDHDAQAPLPYSQRWVDVANQISNQLKPYMAIHWRMERLEPVSNLLPCAMDLIDKVHQLTIDNNEQKYPNVFLLTDYPHLINATGARPESNSFRMSELKNEHHQAIQYLYQHLNISLTSVNNNKIPYNELPSDNWHILPINASSDDSLLPADRSILGIVDKLVAMNAQWFFAGRPGVCAKSSSFTGRISNSRHQAFKHGDENIKMPVKTFDMKKTQPAQD
ncbi:uncharacterized protein ATC70_007454 [Mucor velutinosus]|uniref:O-fucosyltransferase family protein n=1 Tax=Mucor velutinosus TaxID=708070 RepID=A0AAN7HJJ8_9FUNG|nr:hypothetical protein ATC70_007454 [Mucor velutinosus]